MASDFKMKMTAGSQKVLLRGTQFKKMTRRAIRHGWFALAKDLKQTANKDILRRPKGGRVYIIRGPSGRRRRHIASAPGETHANLSGTLRRSLGWTVRGHSGMEFGYGVDKPAPDYAKIELGYGRVKPRPSLQNAIRATNRNSTRYFTERFGKFG